MIITVQYFSLVCCSKASDFSIVWCVAFLNKIISKRAFATKDLSCSSMLLLIEGFSRTVRTHRSDRKSGPFQFETSKPK